MCLELCGNDKIKARESTKKRGIYTIYIIDIFQISCLRTLMTLGLVKFNILETG